MNTYQALECVVDEAANEEKLEEARAELRQFLDKIEHVEDLATDPDRQPLDTFPLLSGVLGEEGICVEASKITVAEHVRARVEQWAAAYDPNRQEGYLAQDRRAIPRAGREPAGAAYRPADIEQWHTPC